MDLMGSMAVHGVYMAAHIPGGEAAHGVYMEEAFTEVMDSTEAFTAFMAERIPEGVSTVGFTEQDGGNKSYKIQKDSEGIMLSESFCV